jgi:hypothetical protein
MKTLTKEQLEEIRRQVVEGIKNAQRGGVKCGMPKTITVESENGTQTIVVQK